jgi:predicted nucleic acid-binding Zn ribbon protein
VASPDICPNCGAEVPPNAKACPECGSDEKTGWSETAYADNLALPDDEFNYNEFVKEEFSSGRAKPRGLSWLWWLVAVGLLTAMLLFWLR